MISEPRPRVLPRGSLATVKLESAVDSQMCCSSLLCFDATRTCATEKVPQVLYKKEVQQEERELKK